MNRVWTNLRMFIWLSILLGIIYPLLITGISFLTMGERSRGSLKLVQGRLVGSELIAQKFTSDKYFWPRPSSIDYNPLPSGGSNLGPTSKKLQEEVAKRKAAYDKTVPSELLFGSGSGLDPHISLDAAYFQIARIAKARGIEESKIKEIVDSNVHRYWLIPSYVNVLNLNLALDELPHG